MANCKHLQHDVHAPYIPHSSTLCFVTKHENRAKRMLDCLERAWHELRFHPVFEQKLLPSTFLFIGLSGKKLDPF